jgi:hypothetical protein
MAYINKEESKAIRDRLKKEFPGSKFGVRIRNHMAISVDLKESNIDWSNVFTEIDVYYRDSFKPQYSLAIDHIKRNKPSVYAELTKWMDNNPDQWEAHLDIADRIHIFFTPEQAEFLDKVETLIKRAPFDAGVGDLWFDKSDSMTDYFHTAFYIDINITKNLNKNLREVIAI